jgi:hypothetical protein
LKNFLFFVVFLSLISLKVLAQDVQVQGVVFDRDSKQRITRVYIYNLRTNKGIFNNSKGEFKATVQKGDTLIAALEGYSVDTATIQSQNTILFYLRQTSIRLKEVTITDTLKSPDKQRKESQKEYRDIYRKGNSKDIFSVGGTNGLGGAGLSIDALYSLLSKEGKNARYLQQIIERDYRESIINYRFTKDLVHEVTGLTSEKLEDFMSQYRPSYYFVLEANDYSLIKFIKNSYQQYLKNPDAYRLPPLNPGKKP